MIINLLFFVAGTFFGSSLYNPLSTIQNDIAYWTIFVLPCALMLSLWRLTATVLHNNNELRDNRFQEDDDRRIGDEDGRLPNIPYNIFGIRRTSLSGQSQRKLSKINEDDMEECRNDASAISNEQVEALLSRINTLEQMMMKNQEEEKDGTLRQRKGKSSSSRSRSKSPNPTTSTRTPTTPKRVVMTGSVYDVAEVDL